MTGQTPSRKAPSKRTLLDRAQRRDDRYELSPGVKAAREAQEALRLRMQRFCKETF